MTYQQTVRLVLVQFAIGLVHQFMTAEHGTVGERKGRVASGDLWRDQTDTACGNRLAHVRARKPDPEASRR